MRGRVETSVANCVERLLLSSKNAARPVSTTRVIRAVRALLPHCEHTDDELETVIATVAIHTRSNVAFDRAYGRLGDDMTPTSDELIWLEKLVPLR